MMQNLDVLQIVDQLCEKLQNTEFGDYDSEDDLLLDLAVIVTERRAFRRKYLPRGCIPLRPICSRVRPKTSGKTTSYTG